MKFSFAELDDKGAPTGNVLNSWEFLPSQERFWLTEKKVVLFSGGVGCGKSMMLVLKAIDLALRYPKNHILMGRKTYPELRDTLMKQFFDICPEYLIKDFRRAELTVVFGNGSEIIFRHLDTVSEGEIRSMNLGAAFIDQAEDIDRAVFLQLRSRLRRENIPVRQIFMSINPELTWHFADFKQNPQPEYELIEASTLENEKNLPADYVKDLLSYPESWRRQYVEGVWDESLLSNNAVFAREEIEALGRWKMDPIEVKEGVRVYRQFIPGHRYQLSVDVAEASEEETEKKDKSAITVVDLDELEEVAHWAGQVPPDVVAEKAATIARWFQSPKTMFCTVIPEMNSIGLALVNKLREYDDISIYQREEFDKSVNKKLKKLGWRTTRQSKQALISHLKELLRLRTVKLRTKETHEEFKSFVYSDEARKSGMGAKLGFHDDRLISFLLAIFEPGKVTPGQVLSRGGNNERMIRGVPGGVVPSADVRDGRITPRALKPFLEIQEMTSKRSWKTH